MAKMAKWLLEIFLSVLVFSFVRGEQAKIPEVKPYDFSSYFVSDAMPIESATIGNPLQYAAARIGIDLDSFQLPRAYENNYRLACRFPIIDYVSNRPLYMKQWAEMNCDQIVCRQRENGIKALEYALEILRGTYNYPMIQSSNSSLDMMNFEAILSQSNFTLEYREEVKALYRTYLEAAFLIGLSRENLSDDDLRFFDANPSYFLIPDGKTMPSLTGNVDSQFEFIERARRVGYEYIFYAAKITSEAIGRYCAATQNFEIYDFIVDSSKAGDVLRMDIDGMRLMISGFGDDTLKEDADFIIDLGGNDVYLNNAGGCDSSDDAIALCIDHVGNDQYLAPERMYVQGCGFLGVGMLVDMTGDDRYVARHFAQGAGIMGVGCLWDRGGDDYHEAHGFCQGAGMFGLGILMDDAGDDFYDCATIAQGGATTLGLGILSDLEGNDTYYLAVDATKDAFGQLPGYGQGGALSFRSLPWRGKLTAYGGVGMLVDDGGNDRYRSKGWCDQGGSYIMSLGVLYDSGGDDQYSAQTGQGSGIHITNAILIDKSGNDIYEGQFRSGGSGGDCSPGFLIDYDGDDVYKSRTSSYGTGVKPRSFSLFIDYQGKDTYICSEPKDRITFNNWDSFGGIWPESEPYNWPYAICLDLDGDDNYQVRNRDNNSERPSFGHGIHLDMEWQGGDVIGNVANPLASYHDFALPDAVTNSVYADIVNMLKDPDTFVRFQAIGRIVNSGNDIIPVLVEAIKASTHRQFNRDIMECLHYFYAEDRVTEKENIELLSLLNALDDEVRIITADDFGIWDTGQNEKALLDAATGDPSASVRKFALKSLMTRESQAGFFLAKDIAVKDQSEDVRRTAVQYLGKALDAAGVFPLLRQILQNDSCSSVRVGAAEALGSLRDPMGIESLREAAKSPDVYLQRAAGKSLAQLYQVEGIHILIESLSFPSIDAFENYNYNVPNFIAAYSGYDLPENERYSQDAWREWYAAHKDSIDIRANADAFREFEKLIRTLDGVSVEVEIRKYEEFLKKFPNNPRVKSLLASKLNQEAWKMVTAARGTPAYNPKTGLLYAKRAVELKSDLNYYDTLAEAYLANGKIKECKKVCSKMLEIYPNERMFLDRLERCKKLKKGGKK